MERANFPLMARTAHAVRKQPAKTLARAGLRVQYPRHTFLTSRRYHYLLLRGLSLASGLFSLILPALSHAELPVHPTVVHGNAMIDTVGNQMTVTNSPNAIINWQEFSIGADQGVHFQQPDAASQVLNRVVGDDPSNILGSLSSNGGVWLINPHGVLFGQNARIDVGALVASTLDISNIDFMAGKYSFHGGGTGSGGVTNQGVVHTSFGGRVWLVGEQVRNEGLIQTSGGNTVLAAGKAIELIDSGAPNVVVRVSAPENRAINLGSLVADGGSVDIHGGIVNQEGIVRADSVGTDSTGRILFKASDALNLTENSQTKASGGNVTMAAANSTYLAGAVDVSRQQGAGGSVVLATGTLEGMARGGLYADGLRGGQIDVRGSGMVAFSSSVSARGSAYGGRIAVTGDSVYLLNADIDASGGRGGMVHLGGGWQGEGGLPHARQVIVGTGSEVKANGTLDGASRKGGEIVVWSTESSEHYGLLQARNGGRIELSSMGEIRQTGAIQAGLGGTVLFDPKNLVITDSPPDGLTMARRVIAGSLASGQPSIGSGDAFGFATALDGDRLAVGAVGENSLTGAVHLFTGVGSNFSGLTWVRKLGDGIGAIEMPALQAGGQFGSSLALRGDQLVVGAPLTDSGDVTDSGSVYLFNGAGADFSGLTYIRTLASDPEIRPLKTGDHFGFAVSLDGDRLAIGADRDDGGGTDRGAVYLFNGVGTDFSSLTQQRKLDSSFIPLSDGDFFGRAVALDGNRLVVGAPGEGSPTSSGAVYLFSGVGTDFSGITEQRKLDINSSLLKLAEGNEFGFSVALRNTHLLVGDPGDDTSGSNRGALYIFSGAGTDFGALTPPKKITTGTGAIAMPDLADEDFFGFSVALDGDRLAVGAPGPTGGSANSAIYLFNGVTTVGSAEIGPGDATFGANPSATSYIKPGSITELLNAGSTVTLRANNDITVSSPITVTPSEVVGIGAVPGAALEGSGGNLVLQAGRNINFSASITTRNGNLDATAGDPAANPAFKEPGLPTLSVAQGVTLDVGSGTATLATLNGNFVNSNTGSPIITSTGRWLVYSASPTNDALGGLAYDFRQFNAPAGTVPAQASGNGLLHSAPLEIGGKISRTYDGTNQALLDSSTLTFNNLPGGYSISVAEPGSGRFQDRNVGLAKAIGFDCAPPCAVPDINVIDNAGKPVFGETFSYNGDIRQATLLYVANPATAIAGAQPSGLSGEVTGFQGTDDISNATTGTLNWTTPATAASPAGVYPINGTGLVSTNYILVPAPGNANALTVLAGIDPVNNPKDKQNTLDTSVQSINTAVYGSFPVLDFVTTGFVNDLAALRAPKFSPLDLSRMSWEDMRRLIEERREFKEKLFADAIYKLELDPSLANVPACPSIADIKTGLCRITDAQKTALAPQVTEELHKRHFRTKVARLPQIERKFAVLFGVDQYANKSIPSLENAIDDAEAVGELFADKLGYEVKIVKNPTKADVVRTLNQLSAEMKANDSVIIYYAGHGYRNEKTAGGYWIPSDASPSDPTTWLSNTDVSSMMSDISAKQMVMIADSCYSGTFAEQKLSVRAGGSQVQPDQVLAKRSVIVMSSGGDEPVADEGKEGHSIFAWDLMQALRNVDNWQPGTSIFEQVKREVTKSFPQTPQYGAIKSAGHQAGGEYLFEFRQLEDVQ